MSDQPNSKMIVAGDSFAPLLASERMRPADWLRIGFYFALGVVLLLALAFLARELLRATLAISGPFIGGLVVALMLDPLVDRIERTSRMPRGWAAAVVFVLLLLVLTGVVSLIVPALIAQASDLASNGPRYVSELRGAVNSFLTHHRHIGGVRLPATFDAVIGQFSGRAGALLQQSSGRVTALLIGSATMAINLILMLIVTLFLLIDLKRLRARLLFLAPDRWRTSLRQVAGDVGGVFSDYVRGLVTVCVLFGIAVTLMLYGLALLHHPLAKYALIVGATAGVLYSVPYLGSLTTTLLVFLVGFISGGAGFGGVAVVASAIVTQVFDNIVTPKVVGGGVGLHPVIAIFALVLGGELFGIWGMLLSVPVAASVQVILFREYPKSTAPTPAEFLEDQGIPASEGESKKVAAGEDSPTERHKEAEADAFAGKG